MLRNSLNGVDRKGLRRWLLLFFIALALPAGVLVYQAYSQLKWEAFHLHRTLAEELALRVDSRIRALVGEEEARSFADYTFLNVAGDPAANFLQRSPLSAFPVESPLPGLIGYFQVDTAGVFSTPLLPPAGTASSAYGISAGEHRLRHALQERIHTILGENRLVQAGKSGVAGTRHSDDVRRDKHTEHDAAPADEGEVADLHDAAVDSPATVPAEQAAFDKLNTGRSLREAEQRQMLKSTLGRVEDLKLDYRYQPAAEAPAAAARAQVQTKRARKERSALPESGAAFFESKSKAEIPVAAATEVTAPPLRIHTFESELDPFEFSLLDSGHFVLFRKVWRDGQRYIQGALLDQQAFLRGVIEAAFADTALSTMSELIVAFQGNVYAVFSDQAGRSYLSSAEALRGAVLYQTRLSDPMSDLELLFSITRLPAGPGAPLVTWVAVILALVLPGGFYLLYRLGAGQIDLARQQQDFVAAVSHELKTPLTSIRMYGELLREGWASEEKKATYYDYIHDESERLSRLITNVLQLARMTRNDLQVETKTMAVPELVDGIRSKIGSQVERAGFELNLDCTAAARASLVQVDSDWFTQIIINLVDNAIKFSAAAERRVIDIGCQRLQDGMVQFHVRDYGPGVPRDQMKKIFRLFYRSENELTRETVGTGIGLALVQQLTAAMNGQVDVVAREPGAEFRVSFAAVKV